MKKLLSSVLIMFLLINLTACKDIEPETSVENIEKETSNSDTEDDDTGEKKEDKDKDITENQDYIYPRTELDAKDLEVIYGEKTINYNMSKDGIVEILGQPMEKISYEGQDGIITFKYNGLEVTFVQGYLDVLQIKGKGYLTARKIQIGDSIEKVFDKYGQEEPLEVHGEEKYYMYIVPLDMVDVQLFFITVDDVVKEFYFCNSL